MKADFINKIDFNTDFGLDMLMVELFDNRFFTARDLAISSRTISYWKGTGVLTWFPPHKTGRFSFMEAAWLCVLKFLQGAGLSIELMKKLTARYIDEPIEQNLAATLIHQELKQLTEKGEGKSLRAIRFQECLDSKSDMDKLRREINYFTGLIQRAIKTKMPCGIVIKHNKEPFSFTGDTFNDKENLLYLISEFHIIIPLNPILTELLTIEFNKNHYDFPMLSQDEKLVLREIRRDDVENIVIKKNKKSFSVKISKGKEENSKELAAKIMDGSFDGWDNVSAEKRNNTKWYIKKEKNIKK